ncbi:MAG: phosphatidylserine decarboxylase family protein [Flavobacteriales bacterium]|jgi:phosphatidylserine decarboxylase|nr:phosphatidylserine decarboxylase family protein [Flavobacteriales bacterium]MBK6892660.1 phosphatidylserine decarboxylase family protein [Flavobacteriales bacterium]MBK7246801.1 phosphatidylserine decarboxylase family protein [Flavobacteriales bacterium]MBK9061081.1 phosphatidylserine decarboxylase family protein [Flavobacteriales bacterium]MBK9599189.1 phosphatidylserine decarboxylase family protein [Flavobacteriales bacterium]
MRLHREGTLTILLILVVSCLTIYAAWHWLPSVVVWPIASAMVALLGVVIWFFRVPPRYPGGEDALVLSPCDGKVVVVEEVMENEYFKDRRIQVSIFMSPLNVHVNYHPVNGNVTFRQYHKGKYLVAWHPKSSTENERCTVVVKHPLHGEVLVRQIAGALARRICTYPRPGDAAVQGSELGFIKFGSRVDLFLPLNATVAVQIGEVVKGATSVIAHYEP